MNNIITQSYHNMPICTCPHCKSASLTRSGFDRGIQRYRCKTCNRTFKATVGSPVHGLHKKEKIDRYLIALRKGMSVRKAAQFSGISKNTSFAWRHKFLSSLEARSIVNTISRTSTVEIIKLKYSAKGRRKLPEKNTSDTRSIALLTDGQLEIHKLTSVRHARHIAQILTEKEVSLFASAPHKTVTAGIKYSENAIKIKNRQISKQMIAEAKQQVANLLHWMERFNGVASKYLQNYWNWYASLLNLNKLKQESEHFGKICINSRSLARYFITKNV